MIKKSWIGLFVGASILLLVSSGCGILDTDSGEPEKARLVLDQSDTPSLQVSTSLNFLVSETSSLSFEDLTVETVTVPFDKVYDITDHLRFYVLVTNVQTETVTFRMRVTIDGDSWYNDEKTLAPGETAQFVYRYQAPAIY